MKLWFQNTNKLLFWNFEFIRFLGNFWAISCPKIPKVINNNGSYKKKKSAEVIVGHVPELLSEVLSPLMDFWVAVRVFAVIDTEQRRTPKGTWTPGGGIEIPCTYKIYTAKVRKKTVRAKIRAAQNL